MPNNEVPKKTEPRQPMPRITLKLTNPIIFNVEIDYECPSLQVARAMLREGLSTIEAMIDDQHAIEFNKKMAEANKAWGAMQKNPGHA